MSEASTSPKPKMHPNIRWTNALEDVFEGKLACARNADGLLQISRSYSLRLDEVTDLGGDHVLAVTYVEMKGHASGALVAVSIFSLNTLRDGLITDTTEYVNRTEALEAVGLEE